MTIRFKPEEPPKARGLSAELDGRILFLPQSGGFWICAEDNDPELIQVHVAVPRRQGVISGEYEYSATGDTVLHIPVAFA